MRHSRREFLHVNLALAGAWALGTPLHQALAQGKGGELVIAYNTGLPSWDPTTGPSAVNPKLQALYLAVFDRFISQQPDLSFAPGILTEWGFTDNNTKVRMVVRDGVTWHDGSPLTPDDIVWSLQRAADPKVGNPGQFVWGNLGNFQIQGNVVTADVLQFEPTIFKWMAFLTGYVMPKAYFEKVGAEGFERAPIGTGPYKVDRYERGAFVRLVANERYWAGKPAYDVVVIKFVTDATSRVAEVESGASQVTFEIPYEEYDRLIQRPGLTGQIFPVADVGMIFLNDVGPMLDKNVRLAAHYAIDKKLIIDRLLRGYGVPLATLEAPEYDAYDPDLKFDYNPDKARELLAASGYSTRNPVRFTIQTTRGFKPKDYEMIQAIVGMWRRVGIEAEIEVYEIAKHFELRAADQLAPAAFYNWGNAIGDPTTSTGHAMFGPSPHSVWDTDDLDAMIMPLWAEPDDAKRLAGWKAVNRHILENAYVIPLLQYVLPVVHATSVVVPPNATGDVTPQSMRPA